MSTNLEQYLQRLLDAFTHHYEVATAGDALDEAALEAAEFELRDAFFTYDDELFTSCEVELPFDIFVDDESEEDSDEDDDDDDFEEDDDDDIVDIDVD